MSSILAEVATRPDRGPIWHEDARTVKARTLGAPLRSLRRPVPAAPAGIVAPADVGTTGLMVALVSWGPILANLVLTCSAQPSLEWRTRALGTAVETSCVLRCDAARGAPA